jgi:integrase
MVARATAYWAWTEAEWYGILQPTFRAFRGRYPDRADQAVRQQLVAIAYLVGPLTDLSSLLLRSVSPVALARRLLGREALEAAVQRVLPVVESWGYASIHQREDLTAALAEALLTNRSPHLEDLTADVLDQLGRRTRGHLRHSLGRLSRALEHLGLIDEALPRGPASGDLEARLNTTEVARTWTEWCLRWYRSADLALKTKRNYLHVLLRVGRWLSQHHPEITTPHQWTVHLAAEYVAAVAEMRVGDHCDAVHTATILPHLFGRPLSARSQDRQLAILRAFFRDLQEAPHQIPRRFDPARAFRTPRTVRHQIGPSPRDIDPLVWARLVHAALGLTEADLPRIGGRPGGALRYPLELVRAVAVVWVYAGLRADEIVRLRVGCVRWQREDVTPAGTDAVLPRDAVCFLSVPVNKTSGAFVKPVNPLVGKRIAEWEQVRAASQPPQRDPKSGGSVAYLFAHRSQRLGLRYLNASVIPTLCRKAGIPMADERGAITSHRARATIATLLYNAPEGLTIWELMQWLGHKDPKSTQHYARVNPTRLASAYTQADRTSHLVEVLVDTQAPAIGEVPVYYVLGDHGLCSNPAWATCEYRMACIKCPFFVPSEPAGLIRSRQTVKHFLEIVELSDHELAAAQDDEQKLAANIQRTQNLRAPQMLRRRAKGAAEHGIPLTALAAASLPAPSSEAREG